MEYEIEDGLFSVGGLQYFIIRFFLLGTLRKNVILLWDFVCLIFRLRGVPVVIDGQTLEGGYIMFSLENVQTRI